MREATTVDRAARCVVDILSVYVCPCALDGGQQSLVENARGDFDADIVEHSVATFGDGTVPPLSL